MNTKNTLRTSLIAIAVAGITALTGCSKNGNGSPAGPNSSFNQYDVPVTITAENPATHSIDTLFKGSCPVIPYETKNIQGYEVYKNTAAGIVADLFADAYFTVEDGNIRLNKINMYNNGNWNCNISGSATHLTDWPRFNTPLLSDGDVVHITYDDTTAVPDTTTPFDSTRYEHSLYPILVSPEFGTTQTPELGQIVDFFTVYGDSFNLPIRYFTVIEGDTVSNSTHYPLPVDSVGPMFIKRGATNGYQTISGDNFIVPQDTTSTPPDTSRF